LSAYGKLPATLPLIVGHKAAVLDIDCNPFNDNLVASGSEDGTVKIWNVPDAGLTANMDTPVQNLIGHRRKVGSTDFNPVANNVLATSSTDFKVIVWDVEKGDAKFDLEGHTDIIQSCAWNYNGSLLATACKDKKMRVVDPRTQTVAQEVVSHQGVKGSRAIWLGQRELLFSIGFSKTSERQFAIWDPRNINTAIHETNIDTASGLIMPYYDNDTSMLYLAGKGDGNIRYYELVDEAPFCHYLTEFKSASPQRGIAFLPKTALDLSVCEIARAMKATGTAIEPISFQVPRKSDMFQDDLYPPTFSGEPNLTSEQWFAGENAQPKLVQLGSGFVKKEAPATEFKPVVKEESGPASEKELRDEYEKLKKRVAYLESELVKKDAKIKELSGGN